MEDREWQSCALGLPYPQRVGDWPPYVQMKTPTREFDGTLYGFHWITKQGCDVTAKVTHWRPMPGVFNGDYQLYPKLKLEAQS